jgi:hypothetical protein
MEVARVEGEDPCYQNCFAEDSSISCSRQNLGKLPISVPNCQTGVKGTYAFSAPLSGGPRGRSLQKRDEDKPWCDG